MVQLIVGNKGKGKTKVLLDKVNSAIKSANGNMVYLDKSSKHMYELNNKVRLIDVTEYPVRNSDEFVGFVAGIISQDHDLDKVYLDSFLTIAKVGEGELARAVAELDKLSTKFQVNFVISASMDKEDMPEEVQKMVVVSL